MRHSPGNPQEPRGKPRGHRNREGDLEHYTRHCKGTLWLRVQISGQHWARSGFGVCPLGCIGGGEGTRKSWREARNQLHSDSWESKERVKKLHGGRLTA